MQDFFHLSRSAVERLADRYGTPLLVISQQQIERNYNYLKSNLRRVKLHYAVKANPDERIIRKLADLGSSFDVASDGEVQLLADMGIEPSRMVFANPIKPAQGIAMANRLGIRYYTFDSVPELEKMARIAPGCGAVLRMRVDNPEALIDLNTKFGVMPENALSILLKARSLGLDVAGIAFHVGSQTVKYEAYVEAMRIARGVFDAAAAEGIQLRILDIGGGFPIPAGNGPLDLDTMTAQISAGLDRWFPDTEIWAEPGRFICGTAVNLITRVIGSQNRDGQEWYFLDDGLYGTFSGVIFDHWDFEMEMFKTGPKITATFAGPSCDSFDVMFRDRLTVPLEVEDLILVTNCGAYTSASATTFNGFCKAKAVTWEEVNEGIERQKIAG